LYDAIIVGGGHNGLTCAAYLARAGRKVLVLEATDELGGFVQSGDVPGAPGFRMNTYGFEFPFVGLKPSVAEELRLSKYGLRWTRPDPHNTYLSPQGTQFSLYRDLNKTCESIGRLSRKDAETYRELMSTLMGCAEVGLPYLADHPTRPSPGTLLEMARRARKQRRHLLPGTRIVLQTPLEIMDDFERDEMKAFIAMNVATGSFRPLDEPMNTSILAYFALLHLVPLHRPVGGAGAFVDALAACVRAFGGEIRTSAPVDRILHHAGKARGVQLVSGEEILATEVVAAMDPTSLFTRLLEPDAMPQEVREQVAKMQVLASGVSHFKADFAVSRRPTFPGHDVSDDQLAGLSFAPSVDYVERLMAGIKRGELADELPFYIAIPSVLDRTLVPKGSDGDSIAVWVGAVPLDLSDGSKWSDIKQGYFDRVIDHLEEYSPGIRKTILGVSIRGPHDLNNPWVFKGSSRSVDLIPSQIGPWRPSPALSGYETPGIEGLWRSGHGTHPMSGTNGWPGRITARTMIKGQRSLAGRLGVSR
jgi:beta-carotene ketolase (CrtO type)